MNNIKYNVKDGFNLLLLLKKLGLSVDMYGGKKPYSPHTISYNKNTKQLKHFQHKLSTILKKNEFEDIINNALKHYRFKLFK